jgi:hypothetical protein
MLVLNNVVRTCIYFALFNKVVSNCRRHRNYMTIIMQLLTIFTVHPRGYVERDGEGESKWILSTE